MDSTHIEDIDSTTEPEAPFVGVIRKVSHPFKDTRGRFRTKSLFKEWEIPAYPAYYTIGPEDDGKYASLRKRYLETADPTEYTFAREWLGGWDHHLAMFKACSWYRELIIEWRGELEVVLRSEGVRQLRDLLTNPKAPYATRCVAAKYLAESGWKTDKAPKRGRPSKVEVEGELKRQARLQSQLDEDAARIGIEVN